MLEENKGGGRRTGQGRFVDSSAPLRDTPKEGLASATEKAHSMESPGGVRDREEEEPPPQQSARRQLGPGQEDLST